MITRLQFEDWLSMDQKLGSQLGKQLADSRDRVVAKMNEWRANNPSAKILSIQEDRIRGIDLEGDWGHRMIIFAEGDE